MKFTINRDDLLTPLQMSASVVERKQSLPILANILIIIRDGNLSFTTTDMEVELIIKQSPGIEGSGEFTIPARKLLDICKALPETAPIEFVFKQDKVEIKSGKSRFSLSTLPAREFPVIEEIKEEITLQINQEILKKLLEDTMFAMAQQDVRYYLNGLLLEVSNNSLKAVATDGHRLALKIEEIDYKNTNQIQVIIPRKAVIELIRLLDKKEDTAQVIIGKNHIRIGMDQAVFTSKLIDGKFPDYEKVIPKEEKNSFIANRDKLRQSLNRASILSNEKYKGIGVSLQNNILRAHAHNAEHEEAQEEMDIEYQGQEMEIGFNVLYLLDALDAIKSEKVRFVIKDPNSSCLILPEEEGQCKYVVMPMRL